MAKPNWKRRGLTRPITDGDRQKQRRQQRVERAIRHLAPELQAFARQNPHLIQ